jgi:hypothetical protein
VYKIDRYRQADTIWHIDSMLKWIVEPPVDKVQQDRIASTW